MNAKDKNTGLVEFSDDELNLVAGGIITAPGTGGGPNVQAVGDFFAYESTFTGGVRVVSGDGDPNAQIFNNGGTLN